MDEVEPESSRAVKAPIATEPAAANESEPANRKPAQPDEVGGPQGPEPTRYGDWERKGRCIDF